MITKMINGQEKPVSNSGDSLGSSVTLNGNPLSFSKDTAGLASNTVITLEPIQAGSGDPSPSNVRAISGYEEVIIRSSSKNLVFDKFKARVEDDGSIASNNYYNAFCAKVESGKTYTALKDTGTSGVVAFYTSLPSIGSVSYNSSRTVISTGESYFEFTAPITGYAVYMTAGAFNDGQIVEGNTTNYYPFATDLSIAMPGTVYGGTLDVESGELVVDRAAVDLGTLSWVNEVANHQAYAQLPTVKTIDGQWVTTNMICSSYKINSNSYSSDPSDHIRGSYKAGANKYIYFSTGDLSNVSTRLNGVIFVYALATPITYRLTPHQVALLQGANVVTTNGTSISLTHRQGEIAAQEDLVALAESVNEMDKGCVSVTGTSTETFSTLCDRLYSLIDINKITNESVLVKGSILIGTERFKLIATNSSGDVTFSRATTTSSDAKIFTFKLKSSGSYYSAVNITIAGNAFTNYDSITANNEILTVYY